MGKNGYGMLNWQNQSWPNDRLAWIAVYSGTPAGINVLHRCDVRACINPAQLQSALQEVLQAMTGKAE